ncbi:MAG: homoserine kinase [Erysipelotrichaceae bacterium]
MIKVRVPATSANVGPGFDSLGIALNLYCSVSFNPQDTLEILGCEPAYANENNLIYQSFLEVFKLTKKKAPGMKITIESDIPMARGLGSSAACIVAGVVAGNYYSGMKLNKQAILSLCTKIEGHPDNITPALYGSLCASFMEESKVYHSQTIIDPSLKFLALIPDFELSTKDAREVLPTMVNYQDAIYNVSRIAPLMKGLEEGNEELIKAALKDKLHQPYRKALIKEYDQVETIAIDHHVIGFYLSGAGPTLMGIIKHQEDLQSMKETMNTLKHNWKVVLCEIDQKGTMILEDKVWKSI